MPLKVIELLPGPFSRARVSWPPALAFFLIIVLLTGCADSLARDAANPPAPGEGAVRVRGRFVNQLPGKRAGTGRMANTLWLWITGKEERRPPKMLAFPRLVPDRAAVPDTRELKFTWLGHSTVLIEIDGRRYLTDPVWSMRCSPSPVVGPRRFFPVPLAIEDLPVIDGIIISHDHYDHLDKAAVKKLAAKGVHFYVPLGVGSHLKRWGIPPSSIREFNWWDAADLGGGHRLVAAPAQHFSGRGMLRNRTLWASWIVIGPFHRVYFGGDGGYQPAYKTIGERYGPFDAAMLEIGAYHANWSDIHQGPENALTASMDLRAGVLLPIHWGTFPLALHSWTDPVERIIPLARGRGIRLLLPRPGERAGIDDSGRYSHWWAGR